MREKRRKMGARRTRIGRMKPDILCVAESAEDAEDGNTDDTGWTNESRYFVSCRMREKRRKMGTRITRIGWMKTDLLCRAHSADAHRATTNYVM